ncbi:MAG: response regulator transcription factor [Acidimicrobiales bacterium]
MRVLVIEDEVHLAQSLARGLRAEGFDVDVTHDGADGLWRAREHRYGAIVLDILLPGMNGYQICRTLRQEHNWTPILMLTAKDGEYDEAEALDTGADDFLSKPFSFVVLMARLRALARRSGPRPPALSVGDLVLDPLTRRCRRGDVALALTARELALLEALLRRAGEVVAKQELLAEVWGGDFEGDVNVVEVYVGYLRRKIDEPFGRQSLKTLRGLGYRLVDDSGGDS